MSILPETDRRYLADKGLEYEEIVADSSRGVIIKGRVLPTGRYDSDKADILILLPPSYPDVPPDMFYLKPWVRLVDGNRYPRAADQPFQFHGQNWQRWSRHENQWRRGVDGIWTMLKRAEHALEVAA